MREDIRAFYAFYRELHRVFTVNCRMHPYRIRTIGKPHGIHLRPRTYSRTRRYRHRSRHRYAHRLRSRRHRQAGSHPMARTDPSDCRHSQNPAHRHPLQRNTRHNRKKRRLRHHLAKEGSLSRHRLYPVICSNPRPAAIHPQTHTQTVGALPSPSVFCPALKEEFAAVFVPAVYLRVRSAFETRCSSGNVRLLRRRYFSPHRIFVSIAEPAASAMPRLCSVCRCSLADRHSPRYVPCQVSQLADGRLAALTAALGQQTTRHPAAHSVYPALSPPAPVDITLAFGVLTLPSPPGY